MQFSGKEYYQASLERIKQARTVYDAGSSYALAMYCAGLAVECLLRAFRLKVDKSFDERHHLGDLFKASRFLIINDDKLRDRGASNQAMMESASKLRVAIAEVAVLWHNNLRFMSEAKLKTHLHELDRLRRIKGDPLKKNARDLIEHAWTVIEQGVALWT